MGRVTEEQAEKNSELHRKHIGRGGTSSLRHDDIRYCIPEWVRDAIGDKLTGKESKAAFEAIYATAFAICENAYKAGKEAAEAHDAHRLVSIGYEAAKRDMRSWLDGEDC